MAEMDAAAQSALDAAIANADAAKKAGDHAGRAAAATAALKLMEAAYHPTPSATPTDAAQATALLEHRGKDPAWREKFFAGDAATVEEFHRLNKLVADTPDVERALSNAPRGSFEVEARASGAEASLRDQISFVADARADDTPDEVSRMLLSPLRGNPKDRQFAQKQLDMIYRAYLKVPRAQWPAEISRAAREYAAIASADIWP
jgi:hypothetical protein